MSVQRIVRVRASIARSVARRRFPIESTLPVMITSACGPRPGLLSCSGCRSEPVTCIDPCFASVSDSASRRSAARAFVLMLEDEHARQDDDARRRFSRLTRPAAGLCVKFVGKRRNRRTTAI